MKKDKAIQILRDTKERLFEKGWQQGSFGGESGPNCILGAIHHVGYTEFTACYNGNCAICLAENTLGETVEGSIVRYNDHKETTLDDIVNMIDRSIKTLESEEQ